MVGCEPRCGLVHLWRTGPRPDRWIRWTTTGCVAPLVLIAGTASYLHMHALVNWHGQQGWVADTPFSVDGMIVVASTTLLLPPRVSAVVPGSCRRRCWWRAVWRARPPTWRSPRDCS